MSKFYRVIREGDNWWISAPNNGGECCTSFEDTVEELNRLIQRRDALLSYVHELEKAGDDLCMISDSPSFRYKWNTVKKSKP